MKKMVRFHTFPLGFLLCILLLPGSKLVYSSEIEYLNSPATRSLNLPFSEAVRVDNTLYLSGQLGNVPGSHEVVKGGIGAETRQTLENISAVLERHGSSLQRLVRCTIFLADINEWPQMNAVYKTFFKDHFPARSAVAGSGLALGARVEMECTAVLNPKDG